MLRTAIGRLRLAGMVEGISFLVLLFIAMPLKYIWNYPEAVSVVGMAHGVLFILYCFVLLLAWDAAKWSIKECAKAFIAAFLPFGPFFIDPWLRREEARVQSKSTTASRETA